MKHINLIKTTLKYPDLLPLTSLIFSASILLFTGRALANNAVLRSMFSCHAQGLGGVVPTIKISYQQGTNLSFLPAGETIKKVWLNDPSQVTMDFDGPMCMQFGAERNLSSGDCAKSSANVIQLRRIERLNISGLPKTDNTLLTVITEEQGKSKLYTFRILYEDAAPDYHTLAIYPDPVAGEAACVRPSQY
ncbi:MULTISPECIES: hypothetical protein [unclassified Nodularia (in: cyanobacteria)]|uniref:hypothetical protein n=1 Tax=unclassified Nodularia (in: cyanobacteria) TaxID=2656917 RepID=UPI00187EBACE|nr:MULTISPECIES: hypothetical protein [unclassified Nodularia (in: cyanobacteria)]MBE9200479.1 hypothetical protein [Nodularia sp. LEGE 06071]MCC2695261.1 hypothetical protein [Nodularia sp. LEGE 04288]